MLLSVELFRNILTLLVIIYTVRFGVNGVVLGTSFIAILSFLVAYYIAGRCIKYSMWEVMKDILPYGFIAIITFCPTYFLGSVISNNLILLLTQLIMGGCAYLFILKLLGSKVLDEMIEIVRRKKTIR